VPEPEEWKSRFDADEIREVMSAEASRFTACQGVHDAAQVIPPGFHEEQVVELRMTDE